jgi:hypothetical protein
MLKISRVLILSLLVVAMATSVMATTTRVNSLADTGTYIADDSNIFRWYGTLPSYSNMVMAEAGQAFPTGGSSTDVAFQALGMNHAIGEMGVIGVYLLNNSIEDGSFYLYSPLETTSADGIPVQTTKFAIMYGYEIEDVLAFGIGFTRSEGKLEVEGGAPALVASSFTTFGGGVRMDVGDAAYFDASLTYGTAGGEVGPPNGDLWSNSSSLAIEGRLFWEWLDDVTLVGHAGWMNFDYLQAAVAPGATGGIKGNAFQLGVAANMDVNTNNMLVFAAEFIKYSDEPSQKAAGDAQEFNATVLPWFRMALESDINSWLTTRVGATKMMLKTEDTDPAGDKTTDTGFNTFGSDFEWFLGAGFHVGDWDVDMRFEHDVPFRLGYWLTGFGGDDPDPPVVRMSGTYRY